MKRVPWLAATAALVVATSAPADGPSFLTMWGTFGSAPGQFAYPHHLAVTPGGEVYVGDLLNHRVQRFSSTGDYLGEWPLALADGIAIAPDGNVYVASHDFIYKFGPTGAFMLSWGGTGSGDGQFKSPVDVAVDPSGFVYVSDMLNQRIQKFSPDGAFVTKWGSPGPGDGQFQFPISVASDHDGNIWVSDSQNQNLQKFTADGAFLFAFGTLGTGPGEWDTPGKPTFLENGDIVVPDAGNHRIQVYSASGAFKLQWGGPGTAAGEFNHPITVASDAAGNLYVADKDNHRVQKFGGVATAARQGTWGELKRRYRDGGPR